MKTLATVLEENKDLIVAFHIGRGGRFYNSGHLSYIGENTINSFTNDLFLNESQTMYTDTNGNELLSVENNGIGCIEEHPCWYGYPFGYGGYGGYPVGYDILNLLHSL